ncbi:Protein serine/threonine kinase, related [Eimeria tenella]|uniref:Protein serine/threonine kinase, related n=1 Tax=Eimeria tenella TaxID=5802 RepID=U6KPU3_EIMTE|nr:Protein serine/threonine kinase, related [Eimeria tenella]CDJ38908.1 Protein serine/threonine kinase, related [Eimeria tenella]|eukprot:XP_013229663.1 Protein serine/threonine kinase, related [Eimeria tenella]
MSVNTSGMVPTLSYKPPFVTVETLQPAAAHNIYSVHGYSPEFDTILSGEKRRGYPGRWLALAVVGVCYMVAVQIGSVALLNGLPRFAPQLSYIEAQELSVQGGHDWPFEDSQLSFHASDHAGTSEGTETATATAATNDESSGDPDLVDSRPGLDSTSSLTLFGHREDTMSEGPHSPDTPLDRLQLELLKLPTAEEAEAAMPASAIVGKKFLAASLPQEEEDELEFEETDEIAAAAAAVAATVTEGNSERLIGASVEIEDTRLCAAASVESMVSRKALKVTRLLGRGVSSLVVEAVDEKAEQTFALRFQLLQQLQLSQDQAIRLTQEAFELEEKSIKAAIGGDPADLVAQKKGLAVPLYTGRILGAPLLTQWGAFHVFSHVQLFERLHGSVQDIIRRRWWLPPESKLYIAHRLLLQVLHLQAAKVTHNDLRLDNCFMRADGSFLLGDFGVSVPLGDTMHELSRVTIRYAEPQLLLELIKRLESDTTVMPALEGDLWSLGVILFELFTNGKLPYGFSDIRYDIDLMGARVKELLSQAEEDRRSLKPLLLCAEVPLRWQELIEKLLEPRRELRISWTEILASFPDLFDTVER